MSLPSPIEPETRDYSWIMLFARNNSGLDWQRFAIGGEAAIKAAYETYSKDPELKEKGFLFAVIKVRRTITLELGGEIDAESAPATGGERTQDAHRADSYSSIAPGKSPD